MTNIAMENHHAIKNGKPSLNGQFSMAILNNQMVYYLDQILGKL